MMPTVADNGSSFKEAAAFYLHDAPERVEWTHTENLPTDNPDTAWKVMAFTATDGERLKRLAGVRPTGRKLEKPVFSFSLAWHPEQKPDKARMLETAKDAVAALGLSEYQALYIAHDQPQRRVHVLINRVHPWTGLAAPLSKSKKRLQKWTRQYHRQISEGAPHDPDNRQ